jgi:hypothetical protein
MEMNAQKHIQILITSLSFIDAGRKEREKQER